MSPDRNARYRRSAAYRDAIGFLESLVRTPPRTRLERERLCLSPITSLLDHLGNPHHGFTAVHITGSKGKGSTALYTEALLAAAGLRTGTFTSPHLEEWTERIRVAGRPIDDAGLIDTLNRLRPVIVELQGYDGAAAPAFFDALVAAAFSIFAAAAVDIAVVEAGIGARLDPTRVCRAAATCVTNVELEHADKLGPAIADIAREKAAIARPGIPLVTGFMPRAAQTALEHAAARTGARLVQLGREITMTPSNSDPHAAEIALAGRRIPVKLRQPGRHMLENAALALALADAVGGLDRLDSAAIHAALDAAALPGRLEVLREAPLVIVDGAHTPASIAALIEAFNVHAGTGFIAVVSITRGKDAGRVLAPLLRHAEMVIATTAEAARSIPAAELARTLEALHPRAAIVPVETPVDALRTAMETVGRTGTVCVTGSMYIAGAARSVLERESVLRHPRSVGSP